MKIFIIYTIYLLLNSSFNVEKKMETDYKEAAISFFRGVYDCEPSVVNQLAGDSVMVSYPIFKKLFGKPIIRGRKAVRDFGIRFCSRWKDAQITIHDTIGEGNKVMLLWSFKARFIGESQKGGPERNTLNSWGGITIFYFNEKGKIIAEIGEESEPGPYKRIKTS